jgi:hypothetical protein
MVLAIAIEAKARTQEATVFVKCILIELEGLQEHLRKVVGRIDRLKS